MLNKEQNFFLHYFKDYGKRGCVKQGPAVFVRPTG